MKEMILKVEDRLTFQKVLVLQMVQLYSTVLYNHPSKLQQLGECFYKFKNEVQDYALHTEITTPMTSVL